MVIDVFFANPLFISFGYFYYFTTILLCNPNANERIKPEVIEAVEALGDPMLKRYITERRLRSIAKLSSEKQRAVIEELTP